MNLPSTAGAPAADRPRLRSSRTGGHGVPANRPLEMGRIAAKATADSRRAALQDAFGFALAAGFRG
jgi:hypothetical protein